MAMVSDTQPVSREIKMHVLFPHCIAVEIDVIQLHTLTSYHISQYLADTSSNGIFVDVTINTIPAKECLRFVAMEINGSILN